jgi:hypothetical protein
MCSKIVCFFDVFDEQCADPRWRSPEPIKLDLLVADLAKDQQVALIGCNVHQFVSFEKPRERRIWLILGPSYLDGEIEIAFRLRTRSS